MLSLLFLTLYSVITVIAMVVAMIELDCDGYDGIEIVAGGVVLGLLWPLVVVGFGFKTAIEWIRETW